ncbi:MAG: 23S rRNA pseudouridine(2604) synthase RluF [Lachnospiraceae bacterium]|nr:23S rRNA pseudouridine(2604) synthase RluF [Lachnospiraceae bacterium]MBP3568112.1 23S rRNA pseudouridine(2604) synthase RluF [Lachnospiraceae bacterium]
MAEKRKKFEVPEQKENGVRINKYLGDAGVCSRREADKYIEQGKVTIDGKVAEMGSRVFPGQKVTFNGRELKKQEEQVLIAFYKPVGIVCTTDTREPDNVIDFLNYGKRIYPIGRLDKDSEGLLLLTNDGDIVNKILRAGNHHEKEYLVTVNKPITPEFLKGMAGGVPILDTVTKPCKIEPTGKCSFKIILTQGLNRQIRRMCEYFDYRVLSLKRVRIMHIQLGHLKPGTYRNLSAGELERLQNVLKNSSGLPAAVEKQRKREQQAKAANSKEVQSNGKKTENRRTGRTVK